MFISLSAKQIVNRKMVNAEVLHIFSGRSEFFFKIQKYYTSSVGLICSASTFNGICNALADAGDSMYDSGRLLK